MKRNEGNLLRPLLATALVAALLAGPVACSRVTNSVFTHEQFDLGALKKVAVLPFQNYTGEPRAGERVLSLFTSELLSARLFQVVDPAQTADCVRTMKIDPATVGRDDLKKLKDALGVTALVLGCVDEYAMQTSGQDSFPVVTVSARLVDVETGAVLWMSTTSGTGEAKVPILALGKIKTLPEMAQAVCRHLVGTIK